VLSDLFAFLSDPDPWDNAGDPGATDWRHALSGGFVHLLP
jgi:hypothetical protein